MQSAVIRCLALLTIAVLAYSLAADRTRLAHRANAAPAGQLFSDPGQRIEQHVVEIKKRRRAAESAVQPIAPSYTYYDFPYYYSRGHYPTHIRPGFVYFGTPYLGYAHHYRHDHAVKCTTRHRRCVAGWLYRSPHRAKAH